MARNGEQQPNGIQSVRMHAAGLNIVTIGGGTGLSTLLRGLKQYVDSDGPWSVGALGAIVTHGWISLRRLVVAGGTSLGVPTTPIDVVGQAGLLLVMLVLGYLAWRHLRGSLAARE